jgi:sugar (pentulose or hexulose) kinase
MAAAVATGEYKNIEDAAKNMIKYDYRIEPNPNHTALYNKKYALYKQVIAALDGVWDMMQNVYK